VVVRAVHDEHEPARDREQAPRQKAHRGDERAREPAEPLHVRSLSRGRPHGMIAAVRIALAVLVAATAIARAAPHSVTVHGSVYADANRDGHPNPGEPGIANAVVAFDVERYATTDARGDWTLELPEGGRGIFWVRVPDGFAPGPVWAHYDGTQDRIDLGLRKAAGKPGPVTFVVTADTHMPRDQPYFGGRDLETVAQAATALDPPPAFFTILGDVTQSTSEAEFKLVDAALAGLGVPYVPVPGNHDWYDDGTAWFQHYGPDNYSFDISGVHFVVWNMSMPDS